MSSLRFTTASHWGAIEAHLTNASRERFAFGFTNILDDRGTGPTLEVIDVLLVPDDQVEHDMTGWSVSDAALDQIHNRAAAGGFGLVEFHNHGVGPPRFSALDERALEPMARYVVDLLGVPYAAAVFADGSLHGEWWCPSTEGALKHGSFATVLCYGDHLRVLNAEALEDERFARQLPLLGARTQGAIAMLRVAVVGAGGTGSHVALQLAHLGFRNVVVLDDDLVEATNLNRVVTAEYVDLGAPKSLVAKRRMQSVDPTCNVRALPGLTPGGEHPELYEVDLIVGCVDHDGPRHRLNRLAIDTRTPYLDIATGVDEGAEPVAIGGRAILVRPGRPCLTCLRELDSAEIGRWTKPAEQQALDRLHGYGTGTPNPSVVYLNGLTTSTAIAELAAWLSGARPPADWVDVDLLGQQKLPGTLVSPLDVGEPQTSCIDCSGAYASKKPG